MMFNSYAAGYASLPDGKSPNIPQRCPAPSQVEDAVWHALCTNRWWTQLCLLGNITNISY